MSTLVLARQIADCLGPGWTARPDDDGWGSDTSLHGPDDHLLRLFSGSESHRTSDHGRLFITADLGPLARHVPHGTSTSHRITVAEAKSPAAIAADIRQRLLPGYRAARTAALQAKQRSDVIDAAHQRLIATVAAHLGAQRLGSDTDIDFGRFGVGAYGSVRVYRGDHHSTFTVHVPRDRVAAFAALVNTFRHTTGSAARPDGTPAEGQVWVLRWEDKHGEGVTLHASRRAALGALAQTVRSRWDNITDADGVPASPDQLSDQQVVDSYFHHRDGLESYGLYPDTVQPDPTLPLETTTDPGPHRLRVDLTTPDGRRIYRLFHTLKSDIEDDAGGWNGGDVVDLLTDWFTALGFDVDAPTPEPDDHTASAQPRHQAAGLVAARA